MEERRRNVAIELLSNEGDEGSTIQRESQWSSEARTTQLGACS